MNTRILFVIATVAIATSLLSCGYFHRQCAGQRAKIDMSRQELIAACGLPDHVNGSNTDGHVEDQYVYSSFDPDDYVYIKSDRVTSMQYTNVQAARP